jgi:uncharacterized membrane protein
MNVHWEPIFAVPVLILLVLIVAGLTGWSLWRGIQDRGHILWLGGFRGAALLVLALLMLQPHAREEEITVIPPKLAVVVDQTESMADPVDESQPRRADLARQILNSPALAKARKSFEVQVFGYDGKLAEIAPSTKPEALTFAGGVSNILGAVGEVQTRFRGQPLAGILLLSDGLDTTGLGKSAPVPGGAPVMTFELEKEWKEKEKSRKVSMGSIDYPARVVVGWDSEVKAQVIGQGMAGRTINVEFWRDGKKQGESAVAFNEDEQTRPVAFPIAPEAPGMVQYELRIANPEADNDAKKSPFVVEAIAPGKRILYVQNALTFDLKFLRKAIVSDRNLQLQTFVRWGDGKLVSMGERGLPAAGKLDLSATGLARYSVVMLGDLGSDTLTPENYGTLKEFVNRGGALILMGGANGLANPALAKTALAEIAPVKLPAEYREGDFPVAITETGLRHPVFGPLFANIKDFPSLLTANVSTLANPTAEVLIETTANGVKAPVIAVSRFGQGRVVAVMTDTVWRWRLAAKWAQADKSPYDTFWTQLMDWLIPKEQDRTNGNKVEIFTERPTYLLSERPEVRAIVRMSDPGAKPPATVALTVKTPDDKTFEFTMKPAMLPSPSGPPVAGYRVELEPNVPGIFAAKAQVQAGTEKLEGETRFVVQKPVTERTGKPIDREMLQRIAAQTKGQYYVLADLDKWPEAIRFPEQQFVRETQRTLWNEPWVLLVLLGLLAGDWVLRKKWNLP